MLKIHGTLCIAINNQECITVAYYLKINCICFLQGKESGRRKNTYEITDFVINLLLCLQPGVFPKSPCRKKKQQTLFPAGFRDSESFKLRQLIYWELVLPGNCETLVILFSFSLLVFPNNIFFHNSQMNNLAKLWVLR